MRVGKVVGTVVATRKDETLVGSKLLVVKLLPPGELRGRDSHPEEELVVAVDSVGAGVGETVLVVLGSVASRIMSDSCAPVDAAVIGIVDQLELL